MITTLFYSNASYFQVKKMMKNNQKLPFKIILCLLSEIVGLLGYNNKYSIWFDYESVA